MGHYFGQLMDKKINVRKETQDGFVLLAGMMA